LLNGEVVGFANFYEAEKGKHCSIGNVIVNSNCRNQGIGKFIIEIMEHIAVEKYDVSELHISCFNTNTKGILLYTKLGYIPYETEKRLNLQDEPLALIKLRKIIR
jgi:ribosomal protein S18 acetylase RimI-like enzyme